MLKFFRQLTRIAFAVPLSILALKYTDFGDIMNILMFMIIYIAVSLLLEPVFNLIERKIQRKKFLKQQKQ